MPCKAFNYDYRCTPADKRPNGATDIEIFEVSTGKVVLAYRIPYRHKAWCNASASLMVLSEGPSALAELQEHHGFRSMAA